MKANSTSTIVFALVLATIFFLVGFLFSKSTWRLGFDMGWLVVSLLVSLTISNRIEDGRTMTTDYLAMYWPALPGFILELLAALSLRDFKLHGGSRGSLEFAIFSCALLIFVTTIITVLRFGCGFRQLFVKDEALYRRVIWVGATAITMFLVLGIVQILVRTSGQLDMRMEMLESLFYKTSLIVYGLLTVKMMFPLVLVGLRANSYRKDAHP
jgi:hypothetical protein